MSTEAAQKAATAATQTKHAVKNIERAAELQASEVVQDVVGAVRPVVNANRALFGSAKVLAIATVGAASYHFGTKAVVKIRHKRDLKKAEKAGLTVVADEVMT